MAVLWRRKWKLLTAACTKTLGSHLECLWDVCGESDCNTIKKVLPEGSLLWVVGGNHQGPATAHQAGGDKDRNSFSDVCQLIPVKVFRRVANSGIADGREQWQHTRGGRENIKKLIWLCIRPGTSTTTKTDSTTGYCRGL